MSRGYSKIRPKKHRVYSVSQVMALYGVCRNTVSNWVRDGLCSSPCPGPQLFRGQELSRFHDERRARSKRSLRHGEFKCTACKAVVVPKTEALEFLAQGAHNSMVFAICPDCGSRTSKILSATECDKLKKVIECNTSLHEIVEEDACPPAGIGKIFLPDTPIGGTANDPIIVSTTEKCRTAIGRRS